MKDEVDKAGPLDVSNSGTKPPATGQAPFRFSTTWRHNPRTMAHALVAVTVDIVSILLVFMSPVSAILLGMSLIVLEISFVPGMLRERGHVSGVRFAVLIYLLIPLLLVMHAYWRIDAAPIPNDYTLSDLRITSPDSIASYGILCSLGDQDLEAAGAPAIGLSEADLEKIDRIPAYGKIETYSEVFQAIDQNVPDILLLWERSRKGRDILERLSTYREIADLSELDLGASPPYLKSFKNMSRLTWAYASAQIHLGNEDTAIAALARLQSITRALHPNCRALLTKLMCIATSAGNIMTANLLANSPHISDAGLRDLARCFPPISKDEASMNNAIIGEYLTVRGIYDDVRAEFAETTILRRPLFKYHSSLRLHRNLCTVWMARDADGSEPPGLVSVWPSLYPGLSSTVFFERGIPWYYRVYNHTGAYLIDIGVPAMARVGQLKNKMLIHDDLLQIVLNARLGRDLDLTARAYSDLYIIDMDRERILSPGPDGREDTKDDIWLVLNPQVFELGDFR